MRCQRWAAVAVVLGVAACRATNDVGNDMDATFTPTGVPRDWGQLVSGAPSQAPEAIMANAVARRVTTAAGLDSLIAGWPSGAKPTDAVVSVPVKLRGGSHAPFGDGQINRSIEWQGWPAGVQDVPMISYATVVEAADWSDVVIVFEISQKLAEMLQLDVAGTPSVQISSDGNQTKWHVMKRDDATQTYRLVLTGAQLGVQMTATASFPATIALAPTWLTAATGRFDWPRLKAQLAPKADGTNADQRYWPLLYRFPTQAADKAEAAMPANQRTFTSTGRGIAVPAIGALAGTLPVQALDGWFAALNGGSFDRNVIVENAKAVYVPDQKGGVHHKYPSPDAQDQTAVGKVITYVVKDRPGGTEVLYTCFDARSKNAEAIWGVPSGAGWHSIGAPTNAETIVNNYEATGILSGWGVETPNPFPGEAPFGAKDVATFRIVRAGEAFTTARGHLHWYAVDAENPVCVTIWKHGCEPKTEADLSCR
jgi:hypothetical protein